MKKVLARIFIIFVLVIIFSVLGYFGYNYYLDMNHSQVKQNFYKYAFQSNFDEIFDTNFKQNIIKKITENSYDSSTNIEFSNSFFNTNNLDLDKLTLKLDSQSNNINKKSDITIDYSNNELFNISILENPKYIGFKCEDVLNNFVAVEKRNIGNILGKVSKDLNGFYKNVNQEKFSNLNEGKNNNIFNQDFSDYVEVFERYVSSDMYKDEGGAIIEQNGEKVETQRYSLTMSTEEFLNVFAVITDKIVQDERIINSINSSAEIINDNSDDIKSSLNYNNIILDEEDNVYNFRQKDDNTNSTSTNNSQIENFSTEKIDDANMISKFVELSNNINNRLASLEEYKNLYNAIKYFYLSVSNSDMNISDEEIKEQMNIIFSDLNQLLKEKLDVDSQVRIITYVANDSTIRTDILLGNDIEIQFDYLNLENENASTKVSLLEKSEDSYNGYTITISKNKTSLLESNKLQLENVKDSKIISKIVLNLDIKGSENSNKYVNTLEFLYSGSGDEGKFSTTISNTINLKNLQPNILHASNALILDDLNDSEFNYFINKLSYRMGAVYEKQLSKMNLINTNISDTILQNNNDVSLENLDEKENLTDVLVETISNQMGEAELAGEEYTIQNLENLEIDGYNIQVSLNEEYAIITINGYKFKIDKDFNLSE